MGQLDTSATINTAACTGTNAALYAAGSNTHVNNLYLAARLKILQITAIREWIEMGANACATQLASATPGGSFAAFRFDTGAGDTNWMAVTCNAGTCTTTSTGVAADTNVHVFEMLWVDATPSIVFKIDGVVKVTTTTNLPPDSTGSSMVLGVMDLTAVARDIQISDGWISAIN